MSTTTTRSQKTVLVVEDDPWIRSLMADLASTHGVPTQDVVNTIVKTANDQLDQVAQTRNIPADRVSQLKQQISERAQEFVTTHRFPARGSGTRS